MSNRTKRRLEELAGEVADEARVRLPGFAFERVEWSVTTSRITFRLEKAFRVEVLVDSAEQQTDEYVKSEIRGQLKGIVPGFGS